VAAARLLNGHLSLGVLAVVLVALLAMLSGGLHLDGLADTFDGLGGGRGDRARMLEIMRDSHIGAHGAAALVLALAAKIFALQELLARGGGGDASANASTLWPLFAAPVFARWAVVPLMVFFRYARPVGLGSAFRAHGRAALVAGATLLPLGLTVGTAVAGVAGVPTLAAGAAALAAALLLGVALNRRLDGLTGDVYGAAIELAEVAFLVTAGAAG
jgi:adenosylcobinamide-GDP ribazoletransferase